MFFFRKSPSLLLFFGIRIIFTENQKKQYSVMSSPNKVLIAEDSSVIQNLVKKILEFQNFEITAVKNGEQVIQLLEKENFDIILLDINMPVMDGMDCVKSIRSMSEAQKSKVPVVAITGNARNYSEEEFKEAGFNDVLMKPLNFDKLVLIVKKLTEK
jgi:CheY-like chemotaxis protein